MEKDDYLSRLQAAYPSDGDQASSSSGDEFMQRLRDAYKHQQRPGPDQFGRRPASPQEIQDAMRKGQKGQEPPQQNGNETTVFHR